LQGALFLAIGRVALLVPLVFFIAKITNTILMIYGFKANPGMKDVINSKFSAQIPNEDGTFGPKPAAKGVTVFLIGARSNQ
jgi:hypothetical protein